MRSDYYSESMGGDDWTVEDVAGLLRSPDGGFRKCCLLIGAGASRSAGIGTGPDFIELIRKRHGRAYARAERAARDHPPTYNQCMAQLTEADRAALVRQQIEAALINWAHIGIGRLEMANCVDRILTTNFDPLASRACALFNRFPAVYDLAALRDADGSHAHARYIPSFVSGSAIYHLHGQHTGFLLLNTEDLLEQQAKRIEPVLQDAVTGRVLIVCGYSGENDPLIQRLSRQGGFPHGLIWVRHDREDPCEIVCDALLSKFGDCHVVRNKPADQFFTELANELELQQPSFLTRPFQHLQGVLERIRPFSDVNDADVDLLEQARTRLAAADQQNHRESPNQNEITELMANANYDEILGKFAPEASQRSREERDLVAWAAVLSGNALMEKADQASPQQAEELYNRAKDKYKEALVIAPTMHQALNNLGNATWSEGKLKKGKAAKILFEEAEHYFAAALSIKPNKKEALDNWSGLLISLAKSAKGDERKKILEEAEGKAQEARKISPDAGAYNIACIFGLRGDAQQAAHWLKVAHNDGDWPSCKHVMTDSDFKLVRNHPEFVAALRELGCTG